MSKFLKALNRIRAYLEINYPNFAAKLPQGLPLEKIEERFQILPDRLPPEVYELYQYCGGWDWETENWDSVFAPYYYMALCSQQKAMEEAKYFDLNEGEFAFRFDEVRYLGVECDEQKFFAIYRQLNSNLSQMVLARLKQELEIAGSERRKLYKTWDSINENVNCYLSAGQSYPLNIYPLN